MVTLQVYIDDTCWSCAESHRIVESLRPFFPAVDFQFRDLRTESHPDNVFAAPTYVLDGHIISLGNPSPIHLRHLLEEALAL